MFKFLYLEEYPVLISDVGHLNGSLFVGIASVSQPLRAAHTGSASREIVRDIARIGPAQPHCPAHIRAIPLRPERRQMLFEMPPDAFPVRIGVFGEHGVHLVVVFFEHRAERHMNDLPGVTVVE